VNSDKRALLLDFGSVIALSLFEFIGQVESDYGIEPGGLGWRGPLEPDGDSLWRAMQRDEFTEREYWSRRVAEVNRRTGQSKSVKEFFVAAFDRPEESIMRPAMLALINSAKRAGISVGILTNELELWHGRQWMDRLSVLRDVDFVVDATHTKILKPDARAYKFALEKFGLPAADVIFIDDQMRNVTGAQSMGLVGIHLNVAEPNVAIGRAAHLLGLEFEPLITRKTSEPATRIGLKDTSPSGGVPESPTKITQN
jgi:putative hydrolase of the HAD superfamily